MNWRVSLIGFLGMGSLVACATVGGLRSEPLDRGVAKRFPVPLDSAMSVLPDVIIASGLGLKESNCTDSMCMVIGTRGLTIGPSGSWGSMARVVVQADGDSSIVHVLSRRRRADETAAKEHYHDEIFSQIEVRLRLNDE